MYLVLLVSLTIASTSLSSTLPLTRAHMAAEPANAGQDAAARTVEIVSTDDMKYDVTTIEAKPGEQLRIQLTAKGTMPKVAMSHNVVVLQLGTDETKFITAGIQARDTDFIAPEMKEQVIAATSLAGNGETVDVTFTVPDEPGEYTFLCTFPAHYAAGMKGTLVVK